MPLIKRSELTRRLTSQEVDGNFQFFVDAILSEGGLKLNGPLNLNDKIQAWADEEGGLIFTKIDTGKVIYRVSDTEVEFLGNISAQGFYNGVDLVRLSDRVLQLEQLLEALENKVDGITPPPPALDMTNIRFYENLEGKTTETAFEGLTRQFNLDPTAANGNAHAFAVLPNVYARSRAARFELRQGDKMHSNGTRTEVLFPLQSEREKWYAFDYYLPSQELQDGVMRDAWANDNKGEIISQWHQGGTNPPLSIRFINSAMRVDTRYTTATQTTAQVTAIDVQTGGYTKDAWVRVIAKVRFAADNTGSLEVWLNGTKVVNRVGMPNCYYDQSNLPRWKVGIYKSDWNNGATTNVTRRVIYFDNVILGDAGATLAQINTIMNSTQPAT